MKIKYRCEVCGPMECSDPKQFEVGSCIKSERVSPIGFPLDWYWMIKCPECDTFTGQNISAPTATMMLSAGARSTSMDEMRSHGEDA